jgi:hypothetical protein
MNENKKGGRIRLIEVDQLLKNKFDIHYKNLNGVNGITKRFKKITDQHLNVIFLVLVMVIYAKCL